ncbi:MAG: RHS repeat-associated core domain-containing protein [Paracoccus sp. (in: a-proteobacteria)]
MPPALAAAHISHEIEHSSALMGFLMGAVVGLAVGAIIVAATVATGGAALAVTAAVFAGMATTGGFALRGMEYGKLDKSLKGPITTGSPNVFYGPACKPAARAVLDVVACKDHGTKFLATGSDSVFINLYPAVRTDDKTECDGTVKSDIDNIFIGAETLQYLNIDSEVPQWMQNVAWGMVIVGSIGALVFGGAAALAAGTFASFALTAIGGFVGSMAFSFVGGIIGEAIGGDLGKLIGEDLGGLLGGFLGGLGGSKASQALKNRTSTGHPVDVATGELYSEDTEFLISGLVALPWRRFWLSSSPVNGTLGRKWHHSLDMALWEAEDCQLMRVEDGRLVVLPKLAPGQSFYHRAERLLATRTAEDRWSIRKNDDLIWHLVADPLKRQGDLHLEAVEDQNGNRIALRYDDQGWLREVLGNDGIRYLYGSDTRGRITTIDKTDGKDTIRLAEYHYDEAGDLIAATDITGTSLRYEYARHLMTREIRRGGLAFYFEWNDLTLGTEARCIKTWGDGDIYWRELTYHPEERITLVRDDRGGVETHAYNDIGLVTETTRPLGQKVSFKYNRFAELLQVTDSAGTASWRYDSYGRTIEAINRVGVVTQIAYASDDALSPNLSAVAQITDGLGSETHFEHDARGNLLRFVDAMGNQTRILRDPRGLPLNLQDDEGTLARYSWTPEGRLADERNAKGGRTHFDYDSFGRLLVETTEGIAPVSYAYDPCGRVNRVIHPDGRQTRLSYDCESNVTALTESTGATYRWEYRGVPLPSARINPDGTRFSYDYDHELNLAALHNEVGDSYRLEYDLNQRLIAETAFDGRRQEYRYDDAGNLIQSIDGHRVHDFTRDRLGRLLRRDSSDGDWASFAYDPLGRMLRADNPVRQLAFRHDALGNLLSEDQNGAELLHSYSSRGQRLTTVLPDGRQLRFGYDRDGAFARLSLGAREIMSLDRDRIGRIRQRRGGAITQITDYDPQGRIERQLAYRAARTGPVFGRSYRYGEDGNISAISDIVRGEQAFRYDPRDRLREVIGEDGREVFGFDPASTILTGIENPRDASVQGGRILMKGDCHYEYDDAGNRVVMRRGQGGLHRFDYGYDAQNQLTQVRETRGRTRRHTAFTYDALGRRVSKSHIEIIEAANSPSRPGTQMPAELVREDTTWFLWNGAVLLAEGKGDESGPVDPLATVYAYEPASFRPAAQIRRVDPEAEAQILIYWLDHLGTPQELSNENGELVWQVALKAWGGVGRTFVERVPQNLRFQGQYYDDETGLHYNRFRHYDPAAGCFLSQDPISLGGGSRLYSYPANPLVLGDPLGLYPTAGSPNTGILKDGKFAQVKAKPGKEFSAEGKRIYSNLAREEIKTVSDLANAIRSGKINPKDIEVNYVVIDGAPIIDNTRTSTALTDAGIPQSEWNAVNQTGKTQYPGKTWDQAVQDKIDNNPGSPFSPQEW